MPLTFQTLFLLWLKDVRLLQCLQTLVNCLFYNEDFSAEYRLVTLILSGLSLYESLQQISAQLTGIPMQESTATYKQLQSAFTLLAPGSPAEPVNPELEEPDQPSEELTCRLQPPGTNPQGSLSFGLP